MNNLKTFSKDYVKKNADKPERFEQLKSVLRLADPRFDRRKDDVWDMTKEEKMARGMFAKLDISVGKENAEDDNAFIFYLKSSIINPIMKVFETHFSVTDTLTHTTCCDISYDGIESITISGGDDSLDDWGDTEPLWNRYLIKFTDKKTALDYQLDLIIYSEEGIKIYKHLYI